MNTNTNITAINITTNLASRIARFANRVIDFTRRVVRRVNDIMRNVARLAMRNRVFNFVARIAIASIDRFFEMTTFEKCVFVLFVAIIIDAPVLLTIRVLSFILLFL